MFNKLDLIALELSMYDIITLSETWLDQSIDTMDILIPNYQEPIRLDRNRHGGGVAVYISKSVPFVERKELQVPNLEAIWAEVHLSKMKVLIGTFYIHPRFADWNLVNLAIDQAIQTCPNLILLGDFNEDMLDHQKSRNIRNIMNTYNLNQLIDTPTRITNRTSTLIDLILTTNSITCSNKGVLDPSCSDHSPIHMSTSVMKVSHRSYTRKIWSYDQADYNLYRQTLGECDWNFDEISLEECVDKTTTNMFKAAELAIPNKLVTIRPKDAPWMHNDIRKAIRDRKKIHKKAKISKSEQDWANFREQRNKVNDLVKNAKINYFKKLATSLQQGNLKTKQWWKITKQFLKQNKDSDIPVIIQNGEHYNSPTEKANILNQYFCKQSSIDDSHASLPPFHIQISNQDVEDVLGLLDVSKACGPDLLSPRLLKEGSPVLSQYLKILFNKSLELQTFPAEWKLANIIPIHKKGDKSDTTNYRPISLISCLGKVLEKCVFKYLYNYLVEYNKITSVQSGFRPKDSAVFQLIDLYDTFCRALDDGKEVRVVFCDISKAFDRVWHRGLLFKLRRMGISGPLLEWFQSYLENRFQRVAIEGCVSDYQKVKAGVPQGSILGPLLFLIYINDIVSDIKSNIRLFADDTSLYLIVEDPEIAADLMNSDLDKIHQWAKSWLVNFNPNKTEQLIISRKAVPPVHPKLEMNNVEIQKVNCHKHLGLIINKTCSWYEHILDITSKAWKRINILRSLMYKLDRKTLETVYLSFIRPTLEYGDIVWDNCSKTEKEEIENVQYEAARIVTGATRSCSKSKLLEETGWDSLEHRRSKHRLITFFKMVNKEVPPYLKNLVPPRVHQVSQRQLRSSSNFQTPSARTNLYQNSFIPKTSKDWNSLPTHVTSNPSLQEFKRYLDKDKVKVPQYFHYLEDRRCQILHTRLRLGCSSLNADLFKNHLSETDMCICGKPETAEHYFLECNKYVTARAETIQLIHHQINIDIILKGCPLYDNISNEEIFLQVHNFIKKSNRF